MEDYNVEAKHHVAFERPNYTQVPNILFDELMKDMTEVELKVTLCIIRKIIGYHKIKPEAVSISQIMKMTGLSNRSVIDGIELAIKRGTIKRVGTGKRGVSLFQIAHSDDQDTEVTSEKSSQVNPSTSENFSQVTSEKSSHTKEKNTKKIDSKENSLLSLMTAVVKKELKQYKTAEKIAKLLLGFLDGKEAELNLSSPISPNELVDFCLEWDKKLDRNGEKLTRPRNLGSVKSAVETWQASKVKAFALPPNSAPPPFPSEIDKGLDMPSEDERAKALATIQAAKNELKGQNRVSA